jgi:hypothetical protein
MINVVHTSYSVADYCQGMRRKEIIVNREYQRSDEVWPPAARSFLIETILLGYPIPKLSLYQIVDLRSRTSRREWVCPVSTDSSPLGHSTSSQSNLFVL